MSEDAYSLFSSLRGAAETSGSTADLVGVPVTLDGKPLATIDVELIGKRPTAVRLGTKEGK